jgi:acyl-CoA reductase-like NAD-dependent aldehyde dehydrogenase
MTNDRRVPLISATGSTRMGKSWRKLLRVACGKSLLEWVGIMPLL